MDIELFDQFGKMRPSGSFTDAELKRLSPAKREIFERVREAAAALEQCEAALNVAQTGLEHAVRARGAATEALRKVKPPVSAFEAWKAAFRPDLLSAKP